MLKVLKSKFEGKCIEKYRHFKSKCGKAFLKWFPVYDLFIHYEHFNRAIRICLRGDQVADMQMVSREGFGDLYCPAQDNIGALHSKLLWEQWKKIMWKK